MQAKSPTRWNKVRFDHTGTPSQRRYASGAMQEATSLAKFRTSATSGEALR